MKMSNVAIYTLTFVAVSVWAAASFAKGHQGNHKAAQVQKERTHLVKNNVSPEQLISDIQILAERLDGVLRTYETVGDAKMSPELDILQSEAASIITNKNASGLSRYGRSAAEINLDVKAIEKRVSQIEEGVF